MAFHLNLHLQAKESVFYDIGLLVLKVLSNVFLSFYIFCVLISLYLNLISKLFGKFIIHLFLILLIYFFHTTLVIFQEAPLYLVSNFSGRPPDSLEAKTETVKEAERKPKKYG